VLHPWDPFSESKAERKTVISHTKGSDKFSELGINQFLARQQKNNRVKALAELHKAHFHPRRVTWNRRVAGQASAPPPEAYRQLILTRSGTRDDRLATDVAAPPSLVTSLYDLVVSHNLHYRRRCPHCIRAYCSARCAAYACRLRFNPGEPKLSSKQRRARTSRVGNQTLRKWSWDSGVIIWGDTREQGHGHVRREIRLGGRRERNRSIINKSK
jgi:hypothetical protein